MPRAAPWFSGCDPVGGRYLTFHTTAVPSA